MTRNSINGIRRKFIYLGSGVLEFTVERSRKEKKKEKPDPSTRLGFAFNKYLKVVANYFLRIESRHDISSR